MNTSPTPIKRDIYLDGQWLEATWLARVVDPSTGEIVLTVTADPSEAPTRVAVLLLDQALMAALRAQAGFDGPLPSQRADAAEAELARWRGIARRVEEAEAADSALQSRIVALERRQEAHVVERLEELERRLTDWQEISTNRYDEIDRRVKRMERAWRAMGVAARTKGPNEMTILDAYDANNDAGAVTWVDMTLLKMLQSIAARLAEFSDLAGDT